MASAGPSWTPMLSPNMKTPSVSRVLRTCASLEIARACRSQAPSTPEPVVPQRGHPRHRLGRRRSVTRPSTPRPPYRPRTASVGSAGTNSRRFLTEESVRWKGLRLQVDTGKIGRTLRKSLPGKSGGRHRPGADERPERSAAGVSWVRSRHAMPISRRAWTPASGTDTAPLSFPGRPRDGRTATPSPAPTRLSIVARSVASKASRGVKPAARQSSSRHAAEPEAWCAAR